MMSRRAAVGRPRGFIINDFSLVFYLVVLLGSGGLLLSGRDKTKRLFYFFFFSLHISRKETELEARRHKTRILG